MPSPIAHAATGLFIAELTHNRADGQRVRVQRDLYYSTIAVVPDFDFIPEIAFNIPFHHGMTHSIVFALLVTTIMGILFALFKKGELSRFLQLTLFTYLLHLVMDWFTASGAGIELFWPFSENRTRSSLALFPAVHHSRGLFDPIHIGFVTFEMFYAALLYAWLRWHHLRGKLLYG